MTLVSWDADPNATSGSVEFGPAGQHRWTSVARLDGNRFKATLVGLPADTAGTLVAVETVSGRRHASPPQDYLTGSLSSDLPTLTLTQNKDGHWSDGFLLTTSIINPAATIILNPDGQIVWWYADAMASNIGRARLAADGQSIWMMDINAFNLAENSILRVDLDGTELERVPSGASHHDFVARDDGSLAWLAHASRTVDGQVDLGDDLVVRDPVGDTQTLWSVWTAGRDGGDSGGNSSGSGRAPGDVADDTAPAISWTHCNALRWQDGTFLVGSLGLAAIFAVDGDSGDTLWTFGSPQGDFVDAQGDSDLLDQKHQFQLFDDHLLVFENGPIAQASSHLIEFQLDFDQGTADQVWSYSPDPTVYTFSLGNPIRLDDGTTIANFATAGQIDQVSASGDLLWRLSASLGGALGYAEWFSEIGAQADTGEW
ncbi:MAG: hypothetical protein GXP62_19035 [Oligoflexia bacterium]|nr:hypothetical protein [Oligoflexia bacterium]